MVTHISKLHRYGLSLVAGPSLLLFACSHDAPPPKTPEAPLRAPEPVAQKAPPQPAYLVVSESIRVKCGVPETPADSPQFDFDDAALRPRGEGILDSIAACMRDGSLKGQGVTIIGHTDPRGADQYNQELGMERANAAKDYLTGHGVTTSSITVKSRGEQDATGTDSSSWQIDRRVEIEESVAMAN
jgi:outer membrane protein OmpA-like peptidoglycan-associated protein